ncbi:MAG TPA: L-rhamnose/proton symporter RhaT [Phycisphaerae bacterium]|nr:L-rhamnose/proton symporter RhaT [Phycisphaerae bacterium]
MEQIIGTLLLSLGGLSAASFYVPSHKIKNWSWETYWITLGFVAWVIMPAVGGGLTTPNLAAILRASSASSLLGAYVFGALWGFGGLMCGLALRYLGLSLGQSISLGVCAIVGTLVPAMLDRKLALLISTVPGAVVLLGFLVCLAGIALCGYAGVLKEQRLTDEQKKESIKDFALVKGLTFAVFGGIMSASMALAFTAGKPIAAEAVRSGTQEVFKNMPILVLALAGGFTTNFISTMIVTAKNKRFGDYVVRPRSTLFLNYFLALISGLMWYGQYFGYGTGATKMGQYSFASWSIFMAAIIIFGNLWGLLLKEWKLVDSRTRFCLWLGIVMLVVSVMMIGVGDGLAQRHAVASAAASISQ